jgi:hypothetical protein
VFIVIFLFSHLMWERAIEDVSTVSTRILNLTKK